MCRPGFQHVQLQTGEPIFWLESGVSETNSIMLKFVSQELKIGKIGIEMQDFFKKIKVRSLEWEKGLKRWVSRAKIWPEKGGLEGSTYLYHPVPI